MAVDLCAIAEGPDVVGQVEAPLPQVFVGAEVGVLSLLTGDALCLGVVLFHRETDGVGILDPPLLGLVSVPAVVSGEAHLSEAKLPGPQADGLGLVFPKRRSFRRLQRPGDLGRIHQRLVALFVPLPPLGECLAVEGARPFPVGGMIDGIGLQRMLPAVVGDIFLTNGVARLGRQVFRYGDLRIEVAMLPTGSRYDVVDRFRHCGTVDGLRLCQ